MLQRFMLSTCLLMSVYAFGQFSREIPMTPDQWEFSKNTKYEFKKVDGRRSMELDGRATLTDFSFKNGTIQVDIYANYLRSFAGLFFRQQNGNSDEVYMRMHKSDKFDALQYTPIFHGESNWQLYKEHQAKVVFNKMGWNTLRVEVVKYTAYIYVNEELVVVVPKLKAENGKGSIGLWAGFGNIFSCMKVNSEVGKRTKVLYPDKVMKEVITSWEISEPQRYESDNVLDSSLFSNEHYTKVATEPSGLLPISKYVVKPSQGGFEKNQQDYIIAKLTLKSKKEQTKKLFFDFSDKIVLYLNGQEIFKGDNSFRSKGDAYQGHVSMERNSVMLPLSKGRNSIHAVVLEKANGWGLMGKFEDLNSISIK